MVKNSGAGPIAKGDVENKIILVECKSSLNYMPKPSRHLKKIANEARLRRKIPVLSTAKFRGDSKESLSIKEIQYYVPQSVCRNFANQVVELKKYATGVPKRWVMLTEERYRQWLEDRRGRGKEE